jgi:hypothetical protein
MNIEQEIEQLKNRNQRVEADKAWEVSWFRIGLLTVAVYIIATLVLVIIKTEKPFLSALIPAVGYFFSMQTLPTVKRWWIKRHGR